MNTHINIGIVLERLDMKAELPDMLTDTKLSKCAKLLHESCEVINIPSRPEKPFVCARTNHFFALSCFPLIRHMAERNRELDVAPGVVATLCHMRILQKVPIFRKFIEAFRALVPCP